MNPVFAWSLRFALVAATVGGIGCGGGTPTEPVDVHQLAGTYRVELAANIEMDCTALTVSMSAGQVTWQRALCRGQTVTAPTNEAGGRFVGDTLVLDEDITVVAPSLREAYRFAAFRRGGTALQSTYRGPCHDRGGGLCVHESGTASWKQ